MTDPSQPLSGAAPGNFLQEVGPALCAYCDFQDKDSAALLTHVMDKHREKITRPAAPVAVPAGLLENLSDERIDELQEFFDEKSDTCTVSGKEMRALLSELYGRRHPKTMTLKQLSQRLYDDTGLAEDAINIAAKWILKNAVPAPPAPSLPPPQKPPTQPVTAQTLVQEGIDNGILQGNGRGTQGSVAVESQQGNEAERESQNVSEVRKAISDKANPETASMGADDSSLPILQRKLQPEPLTAEQWWDKNVLHRGRRMTPFKMTGKNIWKYMDEFAAYVRATAESQLQQELQDIKQAITDADCELWESGSMPVLALPEAIIARPAALAGKTRTEAEENRWENAVREIACIVAGRNVTAFVITDIVEEVRKRLSRIAQLDKILSLCMAEDVKQAFIRLHARAETAEAALTQAQQERDEAIEARREMGQDYALDVEKMSEKIDRFQERNNELADRIIRAEFNESTMRAQKSALMEAANVSVEKFRPLIEITGEMESEDQWPDDYHVPFEVRWGRVKEAYVAWQTLARVYEQVKKDAALPSQPTTPQP